MMSRSVAFQRTRKLLFQNRARLVWSDRKSTRLNSSHSQISYAVFCLKKKSTVDQTAREALYRRIDDRVFQAAPWMYLWFPVDLWAEHPSIEGWDVPVIFNGQLWTKVRPGNSRPAPAPQ